MKVLWQHLIPKGICVPNVNFLDLQTVKLSEWLARIFRYVNVVLTYVFVALFIRFALQPLTPPVAILYSNMYAAQL